VNYLLWLHDKGAIQGGTTQDQHSVYAGRIKVSSHITTLQAEAWGKLCSTVWQCQRSGALHERDWMLQSTCILSRMNQYYKQLY